MSTLLEIVMKLGQNGEYKLGAQGGDSDGDGIPEYDCSGLITAAMRELGYDLNDRLTTSSILNNSKELFEPIPTDQLKAGDVILLKTPDGGWHAAVVYKYDSQTNTWYFYGANSRRSGIGEQPFGPNTPYWNREFKILRPKLNPSPSLPTKPRTSSTITRRDPLMLDLDGDGVISTLGTDAGIHFDHDGNGFKELSGWVAPGDGMLMLDRDADGSLDNGSELFGDFTPLSNGMLAVNGFQALAQFDSNGDGKIDASDPIWSQLKVWQHDPEATDLGDPDTSGIMKTLDEIGIKAIYLDSTITNRTDEAGNTETRTGSFEWTDGRTSAISEYRLQRDTSNAIAMEYLEVSPDIAALPDLQGYGNVYSLHQAMVRDTSGQLKALVESFISETNPANRANILQQIIYKWTGADTVAPDARGPFMDGRQVVVLEKFYGDQPMNPDAGLAIAWKQTYQQISEIFYSSLMSQTHMKDLFDSITYNFDENAMQIKGDLSAAITELQNRLSANSEQGQQDLGEFARTLRGMKMQERVDYLSFRETFIETGNRLWAIGDELGWIIDSAGLPIIDLNVEGHNRYPHFEGITDAEAIKGSVTWPGGALNGSLGNDVIYGTTISECLINESGNATLVAGGADDTILAGAGDDILDGGSGNDMLFGEAG
ncbi:MAG: NlpC/P60 family protein, partial [Nitrospirota bacterium]